MEVVLNAGRRNVTQVDDVISSIDPLPKCHTLTELAVRKDGVVERIHFAFLIIHSSL